MRDRLALEKKIAEVACASAWGKAPRPPHWSGFRVAPASIEFWRNRPFRLHERLCSSAPATAGPRRRLFP
jgi:pyridoxamine 5'-phosphate oxidase